MAGSKEEGTRSSWGSKSSAIVSTEPEGAGLGGGLGVRQRALGGKRERALKERYRRGTQILRMPSPALDSKPEGIHPLWKAGFGEDETAGKVAEGEAVKLQANGGEKSWGEKREFVEGNG